MDRPRPTLVDVAHRAGVSVSTASNALSGVRPVGEAARRRVLAAAEELAYEPDRAARSLVTRRSDTVGIVIPDVTNPFFTELGRGLERNLAERGLAALIGDSDNDLERQRRYVTAFEARRVDGLIVVPAVYDDGGHLSQVAHRTPIVLIDRTVADWAGSRIGVDQTHGMASLIDHLVALGHQQLAFVSGALSTSVGHERLAAVMKYTADQGLPQPHVVEAEFTLESGRAAVRELLNGGTDSLTAICAADDLLAFAVLEGARRSGLNVPVDISLTGFDDIPYAAFVHPALTTVRQPVNDMSVKAVELLVAHLDGRGASEAVILKPELVVRASTDVPRSTALSLAPARPV
jgi:LacI family transcriptional regulator